MFITSAGGEEEDLLSAKGISTISTQKIAELLGLPIFIDKPHATIPGVTVGELGGPIYEFCSLISGTLNETGKILVESRYADLGGFVREAMKEGARVDTANKPGGDLDVILERVSAEFQCLGLYPHAIVFFSLFAQYLDSGTCT